jgi:hypothetical protein
MFIVPMPSYTRYNINMLKHWNPSLLRISHPLQLSSPFLPTIILCQLLDYIEWLWHFSTPLWGSEFGHPRTIWTSKAYLTRWDTLGTVAISKLSSVLTAHSEVCSPKPNQLNRSFPVSPVCIISWEYGRYCKGESCRILYLELSIM